jgi:hypothetical protein
MESRARIEADRSVKLAVATVAMLFVAIVGVGLLTAADRHDPREALASLPTTPSAAPSPPAEPDPSSPTAGFGQWGELAVGRRWAAVGSAFFSFQVPTTGWFGGPGPSGSAVVPGSMWLTSAEGPTIRFSAPERVAADPCGGAGRSVGPSVAALADAVARLPGTRADRWDASVGGFPATRMDLSILASPRCPSDRFDLWELSPGLMRSTRPGTTIAMWILQHAGTRLVIDAEMSEGPSPDTEQIVAGLVDSIVFMAPFAPDGPLHVVPPPEAWGPPVPGALDPGWYTAVFPNYPPFPPGLVGMYAFGYSIRTEGWSASRRPGMLSKGSIPSSSGAILQFSSPDEVATDPCAGTLTRPAGSSPRDLAEAIAAIPGVRTQAPIADRLFAGTTVESVVLAIPETLPCDMSLFQLWYQSGADTDVGPRTPAAGGSTIRVWIFRQDDRPALPRVMVEAETFSGATAELEQEIDSIVSSITFFGG